MRKHRGDRIILFTTFILLIAGLIIIYAIGPMRANFLNAAYGGDISENHFFIRQLVNVILSIAAFVVAVKLPYETTKKLGKWILLAGIVLSVALLVLAKTGSSLAKCELGACRWINIGSFGSLQPAEFLKLGLLLYLSQLAASRKADGTLNKSDFWLPAGVASVISLALVVVVQKDLGTGVVIIAIILATIFASGVEMKKFALVMGAILVAAVGVIVTSPHRVERVRTFINGDGADTYHIENAMIAIGTGGLTGVGVGNSVQATGYLPESINDSVFAVMGETFGFLGLTAVVVIFVVMLTRIMRVAELAATEEQRLVAVGVFAWVAVQMAVNIMAMTGLIPLTGITLPLLSYGGTSMMFVAVALGVSYQLSCYTKREKELAQKKFSSGHLKKRRLNENSSSRRR
ncbi:MAG: FtsW/RodA/SpoVE family cell cycle protein [Bacteroidaceae bacterium]|nr:FtsW/RodA/SpoVE family cell cycle protein [Bacteroidaceae bacterium]MBR3595276.1 FtsW/RodA/SpoVE family cell cycle protein [Candidatus Saccharibacteria bacterium]MBR6122154.1 FtsW/RodA/SpoVE family cell cycle protein [Candidatus Saccharibacteria bacterium]